MPKGFQKGNTLAKQSTISREEHKENMWEFVTSGGLRKSVKILNDMLDGNKLVKEQKEGVELLLKFMPYVKARKTDITTDGKELPVPILSVPND